VDVKKQRRKIKDGITKDGKIKVGKKPGRIRRGGAARSSGYHRENSKMQEK